MFAIKRANLPQSGVLDTMKIAESDLKDKKPALSKMKNGLNFWDDQGLFCFARFSHAVLAALQAKTYTLDQLIKSGLITAWKDAEGVERYTIITPEEARRGQQTKTVAEIAAAAKPISVKNASAELAF